MTWDLLGRLQIVVNGRPARVPDGMLDASVDKRHVGRAAKIQRWRRRVLLKMGSRMHLRMMQRLDDCSLAVLDASGIVVCWYGPKSERELTYRSIVNRHVSQFYLDRDVAIQLPHASLHNAVTTGASTREGWRLDANREPFWSVTEITPMRRRDGQLKGFLHVIRASHTSSAVASAGMSRVRHVADTRRWRFANGRVPVMQFSPQRLSA